MRIYVCLAIVVIIVLLTGCTGTADTVINSTTTTTTGTAITTGVTETKPSEPAITTTVTTSSTAVTTTPPVTTTTTTTTTKITSSEGEELSAYLSVLVPVITRHTSTKQATNAAREAFGLAAPDLDSVQTFVDAIVSLKPQNESELADASAIVPPASESDFHTTVINAISRHLDGLNYHITYYTEVLATGTGNLDDYVNGNNAFDESTNTWYNVVLPHIEELVAEIE